MAATSRMSVRARKAIAWGLVWFAAGQVAFRLALQAHPVLGDPEFGRKLADVKSATSAGPGRPLILMLGSSRVATGFRPGVLSHVENGSVRGPIVFNFAQVGSGPEMAHLSLQRLLDAGVRPDWVFVEFWPPTWTTERTLAEFASQINVGCLDWPGVRLLARYVARPRKLYRQWAEAQLVPLYTHRETLLRHLAPRWCLANAEPDRRCRDLDALGWWHPTPAIDPAERSRLLERYRKLYEPRLRRFHVERTPDRALRALLALCRREQIQASVVVLPEGEPFRRLYPAPVLESVKTYLDQIARECRVTVVDARTWVVDDGFMDGHHLLPEGAAAFTQRLGHEVLEPSLARAESPLRRE